MTERRPQISLLVHYTTRVLIGGVPRSECRAALITELGPGEEVALTVFNPSGQLHYLWNVPHEEIPDKIEPGPSGRSALTWHWMECV
jgi:hypothetical protein